MQVTDADADVLHVIGQFFRHSLCKRRDENLVSAGGFLTNFPHKIVNLRFHGTDGYLRIQKTGRTDDLLRAKQFMLLFILVRRRRNEQHLVDLSFELREGKGAVAFGRRQAESVFYKCRLSRLVTVIHASYLRNRDMGLVHDDQVILRKIIHQRIRRIRRRKSRQMHRIVLDSGTEAGLPEHLEIVSCPLVDPLGFDVFLLALEIVHTLRKLGLDVLKGLFSVFLIDNIMGRGKYDHVLEFGLGRTLQRVNGLNAVNLVSEKFHAVCLSLSTRDRVDLHHVAPHTEGSAPEIQVASYILHLNQAKKHFIPVAFHAGTQGKRHVLVINRAAESVNAGHRRNDNHVSALGKGSRRGVS